MGQTRRFTHPADAVAASCGLEGQRLQLLIDGAESAGSKSADVQIELVPRVLVEGKLIVGLVQISLRARGTSWKRPVVSGSEHHGNQMGLGSEFSSIRL